MKLPKFLLADNSDFPEDLFVVHTEYPRSVSYTHLDVYKRQLYWIEWIKANLNWTAEF